MKIEAKTRLNARTAETSFASGPLMRAIMRLKPMRVMRYLNADPNSAIKVKLSDGYSRAVDEDTMLRVMRGEEDNIVLNIGGRKTTLSSTMAATLGVALLHCTVGYNE